ncbi:hypothetical protein D3C73_899400 [compost metagenome]
MEQYKFNTEHAQMIVESIVEGYHDYIEHRKDRRQKMKISSAFAWTKGNFIESKIADECEKFGFSYQKSKAGLTWDYLQFTQNESNILFLIKNAAYFDENAFSKSTLPSNRKGAHRTYLHELSKINTDLDFPSSTFITTNQGNTFEQLTLFVPERSVSKDIKEFHSYYNQFHILTYSIDDAYQISSINQYIPNPHDNIAYLVEDLSTYISGAELTDEDREVIAPETYDEVLDASAFDIGILDEEMEL